jgi:elongation factor 3
MVQTEEFRNPKPKQQGPNNGAKGGRGKGGRGKQQGGRGGRGGRGGDRQQGGKNVPRDDRANAPKNNKGKKEKKEEEPEAEPEPVCPEVPLDVTVTGQIEQATVAFTAPFDGLSPITSYTVTCMPGNITVEAAASPIVVTGLTVGESYTFTVVATNAVGTSPASAAPAAIKMRPALIVRLLEGTPEEQKTAGHSVADLVKSSGISTQKTAEVLDYLRDAMLNDASKAARMGCALAFNALVSAGPVAEAFVFEMLPTAMKELGSKAKETRQTAEAGMALLNESVSPLNGRALLPIIIAQVDAYEWQAKLHALKTLLVLSQKAPGPVGRLLEIIVPALTSAMGNTKRAISETAGECMTAVCESIDNRDVKPFVPALVSCMGNPTEVPEAVNALAGTTFVQAVTAPVLSVMVPVLVRGLTEGTTAVKRQTCVIIDNFAKLVEDPEDVRVFLPKLLPGVQRAMDEIANPEARTIAERANNTLLRVSKSAGDGTTRVDDEENICAFITKKLELSGATAPVKALLAQASSAVASVAAAKGVFTEEAFAAATVPYLTCVVDEAAAKALVAPLVEMLSGLLAAGKADEEDDDEGIDLCNCEFSLAYGSKILLNQARLRLKKGRRYGLVGPNGCGKSTLMRSIVEGQLDGFPPPSELKTVYVECDISPDLAELNVSEFVMADPALTHTTKPEELAEVLSSVGFTDVMRVSPVSSLSGGWRMKLALARAMLKHADILLLDEPTNHLDVANVTWVVDYLCQLEDVTSIIVSHDTGFLQRSCTDICYFNYLKLKNYRMTLKEFVEVVPEASAFFELKSDRYAFSFPDPSFLEGVKSRGRAILKMQDVGFTYPGTTKQILFGISIFVSMASRCAVVGPNGAGKSTMIKLLTGELVPDQGTVWKHPNLVLAYVAQHAFHHIENHLSSTPNEYIRWRYQGGEDKEGLNKLANQINEEDEKEMAKLVKIDGVQCYIKRVKGKRKGKRGDEYETEIKGKNGESLEAVYLSRDKLNKFGWDKVCRKVDLKALAEAGNSSVRTLSTTEVEKHLGQLGLEPEFATHTRIDSLSTSQKVKVVLAAATWNNPHIIVLDEPTNYLDRESLGALAQAIRDFKGGVVMISHNNEFTSALCPESWVMSGGKLVAEGAPEEEDKTVLTAEAQTEVEDGRGNKSKVKKSKSNLSRAETKALKKRIANKKKNGIPLSSDEEEFDLGL